jgi:N utilization substance protein A
VLVREDQLSLAIGRRGQNVRLASKLVGWDIEIMTSEELDELIEKSVGDFTQIEGVDTELAEKLVEQGILSFDDLSVMEIPDLVNTIEGLTEEQAEDIRTKAEVLAEAQGDEAPRRKGKSSHSAPAASVESPFTEATPAEAEALAAGGEGTPEGHLPSESELEPEAEMTEMGVEPEAVGVDEDGEMRDLAIAEEGHPGEREVTFPPSDADQGETERIVTEAVELGSDPRYSEHEIIANEAGTGPNFPPLPPTEHLPGDQAGERDSDMHQP